MVEYVKTQRAGQECLLSSKKQRQNTFQAVGSKQMEKKVGNRSIIECCYFVCVFVEDGYSCSHAFLTELIID